MNLKKYYIFLLSTLLYFSGCVSSRHFNIEVLKVPQDTLLKKMPGVATAQNLLLPSEENCGGYYFFYDVKVYDSTCRKEELVSAFKDGLLSILGDSQFFYSVADTVFPAVETAQRQLSGVEMISHFKDRDADVLMVIDDISIMETTNYISTYYAGYAYTMAMVSAIIRFFNVEDNSFITIKRFTDNIYWTSEGEMDYLAFLNIENTRGELLNYIAYQAGEKFATSLFPTWKTEQREILVSPFNNQIMINAANAALRHDWDRAVYLWDGVSKEKRWKSRAASAFYNKAVYEELNGNFEQALDFVNEADRLHKRKRHENYRTILNKRIEEQEKLDAFLPDEK
ncbi:MAG: DUF6340 family protein [Bacteroidales bacterium]|jgi:hypothetical protein|nr:DUF6340 family protein [Bacteroidales bacterium]